MKREKFMFFRNFFDSVPEAYRKEFCYALANYAFNGVMPEDEIVKALVSLVIPSIEKNLGGAPKGNKNASKKQPKTTVVLTEEQQLKRQTETETETEEETEAEAEAEAETEEEAVTCFSQKQKKGCRFENSVFFSDVAPDEFLTEAEKINPNVDPFEQYKMFKDYWVSASGRNAVKLDWIATWRNWIRRAYPSNSNTKRQKTAAEMFADMTNW